ncbi:MAG: hypothetical protein HY611_04285 [Elusimicrobia bacterium]|nr:hypothetical protein [Elusimicrobiota bacterium]
MPIRRLLVGFLLSLAVPGGQLAASQWLSISSIPVSMTTARYGHTFTVLVDGNVLAVGGYTGASYLKSVELFISTANIWKTVGAMSVERTSHTATLLPNGQVLVTGGVNSGGTLGSAEVYIPKDERWASIDALDASRAEHTATLLQSGLVLVAGGRNGSTFLNSTEVYDTANGLTGNWATLSASLSHARAHHTATLLNNGNVLAVGGLTTGSLTLGSVEFFRPSDEKWVVAQPLQVGRSYHTATLRADGDVLVVGGLGSEGFLSSSELYRVIEDRWDPADFLLAPRRHHTANLLPNGRIIVAGGKGIVGNPTLFAMSSAAKGSVTFNQAGLSGTITGGNILLAGLEFALLTPHSGLFESITVAVSSASLEFSSGTFDLTNAAVTVSNVEVYKGRFKLDLTLGGLAGGVSLSTDAVSSPALLDTNLFIDKWSFSGEGFIFSDSEIYDPLHDPSKTAWELEISTFVYPRNQHAAVTLPNGDIFAAGGIGTSSIKRSELRASIVSDFVGAGSVSKARVNHTLTLLPNGKVLAAGGSNGTTVLDGCEIYDAALNRWSLTGKMTLPRNAHSATLLPNGNVLVAGGFAATGSTSAATETAEIFFPKTGTWHKTGPMSQARYNHTATLLPNGNVLVAGGFRQGSYLSTAEIFVTTAGVWMGAKSLSATRALHTATLLTNGNVLVVGGFNESAQQYLNSVEAYSYKTDQWSAKTVMTNARFRHTATLLSGGDVLVTGGDDGGGEMASVERYNPILNLWTAPGPLNSGRHYHTATLLPNGGVLIAGGASATAYTSTSEIFNPAFSKFLFVKIPNPRGNHGAVLMADGNILLAGGRGSDSSELFSAEKTYYSEHAPTAKRPVLSSLSANLLDRGGALTVLGKNFLSGAERGHPQVTLQALDSGGGAGSQGSSNGYLLDVSSLVYSANNAWSKFNSSITFILPSDAETLPYGWYHLRLISNGLASESAIIQVGPDKPASAPANVSAAVLGTSSISWTWSAVAGVDGYNIYSSSSGILISSTSATTFLKTDFPPSTGVGVQIAGFTLSGDGPLAVVPVVYTAATPLSGLIVSGIAGSALDTHTLFWSWTPIQPATGYRVFQSSTGQVLASPAINSFTQTGLSTNTAQSIRVVALAPSEETPLSSAATAYTLAAVPDPVAIPITEVSSGSFAVAWNSNGNPSGTKYLVEISTAIFGSQGNSGSANTPELKGNFNKLTPNQFYTVRVSAFNGDAVQTAYQSLESTYTLAAPPQNLRVVRNETVLNSSTVEITWTPNGNAAGTLYEVTLSSNDFVTILSTPVPFASNFTSTGTVIANLLGSTAYFFRVIARNQNGATTAFVQVTTTTLTGVFKTLEGTTSLVSNTVISGSLTSLRQVTLRTSFDSFSQAVKLQIQDSSNTACGSIPAGFSVEAAPALQPLTPLSVKFTYLPADVSGVDMGQVTLARYDPGANACVPIETRIDANNFSVTASLNHLSTYQLVQVSPQVNLGQARIFPNPFYPSRGQGWMTFDRLTADSQVKIFTLRGQLIYEATAGGSGIVTWNGRNHSGERVASGVYLLLIQSSSGKRLEKMAVIR